jgi:hypothetical protein
MLFPLLAAFHDSVAGTPLADRFLNARCAFNGVSSNDVMAVGFAMIRFARSSQVRCWPGADLPQR